MSSEHQGPPMPPQGPQNTPEDWDEEPGAEPIKPETLHHLTDTYHALRFTVEAMAPSLAPGDIVRHGEVELCGFDESTLVSGEAGQAINIWRDDSGERILDGHLCTVSVYPNPLDNNVYLEFHLSQSGVTRQPQDIRDMGNLDEVIARVADETPEEEAERMIRFRRAQEAARELTAQTGLDFVSDKTAKRLDDIITNYVKSLTHPSS